MLRSPRLFVEAKGLEKDLRDRKWISQVLGYATVVGVEGCILTNLVTEFALYYSAYLEGLEERRFTVYCEHGDQFDPISRVEDYSSSSSTPLGHHVVSDFEHRIVPLGKIAWILGVSEMKNLHPRSAIP
jgi:hypothetical protein